jgi:zinc transport system substrate-binding protein
MNKKIITLLLIVILGTATFLGLKNRKIATPLGDKLPVTVSFYPYYFFASEIGGEAINIVNLTPAGVEPHDFEPTTGDIVRIQSSRLLIVNGEIENWLTNTRKNLKDVDILEAGTELFTEEYFDENEDRVPDPHIWLSPQIAKKQAGAILQKLIEVDPDNKSYYTTNAQKLLKSLDGLDREFKAGLAECRSRNIVTTHAAFTYLAKEYGLRQISISGLSPDREPSLKELAEISEFAKKNNVKYIFFETLVSPKLAETVAREVGAQTLVLNPLEGLTSSEISEGKTYLTVMRENLHNLRTALECL